MLAFAAEEAWSWFNDGSVHTAAWPEPLGIDGDPAVLSAVGEALIGIRRAKTEAKASQKTPVDAHDDRRARGIRRGSCSSPRATCKAVGRIAEITYADAETTRGRPASSSPRRRSDMQLGTRWTSGGEPPAAVPEALRAQIAAVETAIRRPTSSVSRRRAGRSPGSRASPIAELDTGVIVSLDEDGEAVVRHDDDDGFG